MGRAMHLMLTGETITAAEAEGIGLVTKVVDKESLKCSAFVPLRPGSHWRILLKIKINRIFLNSYAWIQGKHKTLLAARLRIINMEARVAGPVLMLFRLPGVSLPVHCLL